MLAQRLSLGVAQGYKNRSGVGTRGSPGQVGTANLPCSAPPPDQERLATPVQLWDRAVSGTDPLSSSCDASISERQWKIYPAMANLYSTFNGYETFTWGGREIDCESAIRKQYLDALLHALESDDYQKIVRFVRGSGSAKAPS